MQFIEDGVGSYYLYRCTNPKNKRGTIIFIHGFATTSEYHDVFIKHIIDEFDYIAIQLPGAGVAKWKKNKKPTTEDMYLYCFALIQKIIRTHNINSFIVLGHSMGGGLAVRIANAFKKETICLIASTPMNSCISITKAHNYFKFNPKTFKKCFKLQSILYFDVFKTKNHDEKEIERFVKEEHEYQMKHYKFFVQLKKSMFSLKNRNQQRANEQWISCPTLVIAGKYDVIIPPKSLYKAFQKKQKDKSNLIKIELMSNSAHIPFQEQEYEYAKEIKDFINLSLKQRNSEQE